MLKENTTDNYVRAIRRVPGEIVAQAAQMVAMHRPKDVPAEFEPRCMAGLTPEEHGDLNRPADESYPGGDKARKKRIAELREKYTGDFMAQQQIDAYAKDNQAYKEKLQLFIEAVTNGDTKAIKRLRKWFAKNYPDLPGSKG